MLSEAENRTDVLLVTGGDREHHHYAKVKENFSPRPYIIGVDDGALWLFNAGEPMDIALGDFDTIGEEGLRRLKEEGIPILPFPPEKDYTDTELAVIHAISQGARRILIYAGLGTRFDHSFANVHLLYRCALEGVEAQVVDRWNRIRLIRSPLRITKEYSFISLIPFTEQVEGVTLTGFKYPLHDALLVWGKGIGISNELVDQQGLIQLRKGWLLVIESSDEVRPG